MKKSVILLVFTLLFAALQVSQAQTDRVKRVRELLGAAPKKTKAKANAFKTTSIELSIPGRSLNYFWDNSGMVWNFTDTSFYQYDAVGRIISETHKNNGPISRTQYTFNPSGELVKQYDEFWNVSLNQWEPTFREIYAYDSQGNLTLLTGEFYDNITQSWEMQYGMKALITYNSNGWITDYIYQNWNSTGQVWENSYRETAYIYDLAGNIIQYESKIYNNNTWENDSRYKLSYGGNNQPLTFELEIWNGFAYEKDIRYINLSFHNWCGFYCDLTLLSTGTIQAWGAPQANQWNTVSRTQVTLDGFGGSVQLDEEYLNNQWQNQFRYTESYDNQFRYTGWKSEDWNNNQWEVNSQTAENHTYDASFNLTQTVFQFWNFQNNSLENNMKKEYGDFATVVGLNKHNTDIEFEIFPNPVETEFSLLCRNSENTSLQFSLYDAFGRMLMSVPVEDGRITVKRGDLPAGLYVYELVSAEGAKQNGKLILK